MILHKNRQNTQVQSGIRPFFLVAVFVLGFGMVGTALHHFSSAATSGIKLYLSPAAQVVTVGDSMTAQIRIQDTGKTYFAYAKAEMTFPVNLLQVTGISATGSDFSSADQATYDNAAGTIDIARGSRTLNLQPTDFLLATVTFTAKTVGSANVAFTDASIASFTKGLGGNVLTNNTGGSYTIQSPVQPIKPGTGTTPPAKNPVSTPTPKAPTTATTTAPSQTPATLTTPPTHSATPGAKTAPKLTISRVHTADITTAGGTLEWQTSRPSTALIRYDANSHNYSTQLEVSDLETIHSVALHNLPRGSSVYYKILATAEDGSTATYSGHFATAKPKHQTFALVSAASGGGLGLVVLALLVARLTRHRKLPKADTPAGATIVAPAPAKDMSHAIAALALEHTTSPAPTQAIQQASAPPTDEPQKPQHNATQISPRQRAVIEPIPRKIVTVARPTLRPELPSDYTHVQIDENLAMPEQGSGYPREHAASDGGSDETER